MPVDFDGSLLRWDIGKNSGPVTYEIKADDADAISEFEDSIDEAAQIWTSVSSSYLSLQKTENNADITINLEVNIDGSAFSTGYAIFDEMDSSNNPAHCAIYVSVAANLSYDSIRKTILHELGHCLGLGHSLISQAIMSYELDKNSFALDIDDEAAVARLYPADGSTPKLPPGCSIGHAGMGSLLLLIYGLLAPAFYALAIKNKPGFTKTWS